MFEPTYCSWKYVFTAEKNSALFVNFFKFLIKQLENRQFDTKIYLGNLRIRTLINNLHTKIAEQNI